LVTESREAPRAAAHEQERRERAGHDFDRDLHPERYPRESLTRLEEGILEDEELRHSHDHLGTSEPDRELKVDDTRNFSRFLIMLGAFLLVFAGVLLMWDGWDLRSGSVFFNSMTLIAVVVGCGLIVWGLVERNRIRNLMFVNASTEGDSEQRRREAFRGSDRAA
jgi:hypothetical protein